MYSGPEIDTKVRTSIYFNQFVCGLPIFINGTVRVVIYEALCFDVAPGQMNGAPNETRTHSCRFASLIC